MDSRRQARRHVRLPSAARHPRRGVALTALVLLVAACAPSTGTLDVEPDPDGAAPATGAEPELGASSGSEGGGEQSASPPATAVAEVATLDVSVLLGADGRAEADPRLFWVLGVPAALTELPSEPGHGTARLWADDGALLGEGPAHRFEATPDCESGAECSPQAGVRATLIVADDAQRASRLELEVGGEVLVEVERGEEVRFEELDLPPEGELEPPATVAWRASGGEVAAALRPAGEAALGSGAHTLVIGGPATGETRIETEHLYPGDGTMLELVVADGLAFDRVVAGPYRSGVALETEWEVLFEGEPIGQREPLVHDPHEWAYLLHSVAVLVRRPEDSGWSSGRSELRARWVSDIDGDLAPHNLEQAPELYVPSSALTPGEHTLTLELEVATSEGPARHEAQLELHVVER